MRLMLRLATLMVFLGVSGSLSHGAVTITGLNLQVIQNQQVPPGSGAYTIVLKDTGTGFNTQDNWAILTDSPTDRINSITVQSPAADRTIFMSVASTGEKFASIGSISYDSQPENRYGMLWVDGLRCAGDVGTISVFGLANAVIDGSITGDLAMVPVFYSPPRILVVQVLGDVRGNITLPDAAILNENRGFIQNLNIGGNLGGNSPSLVTASRYVGITVSGVANIDLQPGASNSSWPVIRKFQCDVFNGTIRASRIELSGGSPFAFVKVGKFSGTLLFSNGFRAAECGGCAYYIETNPSELVGRVIINAGNDPDEQEWTAPVRVGDPLNGGFALFDLYTPTSAQLGGGSAGLIPFAVHKTDCNPVHNSTITPTVLSTGSQPFVRWYGPISWSQQQVPLVISQRKINAGSGDPTHDLSACFSFKPSENETQVLFNPVNSFIPVGDYVIKAASGIVKNDVLGTDVGDVRTGTDGELRFSVRWPCPGDFNGDNVVNTSDLVTFLAQFGQSGPCGNNRDLDGDLAVNTADLTMFLGQFGNTCTSGRPGAPAGGSNPTPSTTRGIAGAESSATTAGGTSTEAGRPGAPAPMPPVLEALGFNSIEQYTAYVDTLSDEQLSAHIVQLLQTIEALNLP